MRNLIELIEEYPEYFGKCIDERDVIKVLDNKHTSRETYYLDRKGLGTFNINDDVEIKHHDTYDTCEGYYTVEFGIRNVIVIKVFIEFTLEDYDEEDNIYLCESYVEIGWE